MSLQKDQMIHGQPQQPVYTAQPQNPMYMPQQQQQQQQTTVVLSQPTSIMNKPPQRGWNEGLCGCFSDIGTCCFAFCCPYCFDCYLAVKAGESCCLPCCLPCGWLIALRVKHRTSHNIQGSVLGDCCTTCCCGPCASCQLAREIDKYGN